MKLDDSGAAPVDPQLAAAAAAMESGAGTGAPADESAAPGAREGAAAHSQELKAGAMALAGMLVNVLADGLAQRWPATAYTIEERTAAAVVLVPVFMKYGLDAAWLKKYQEEIAAGAVYVGLGFTGFQRVRAARAAAPGAPAAAAAPREGGAPILGDVPGGAVAA